MFKAIQQCQLVNENGSQCKTGRIRSPFGGHLTVSVKDPFEVFVEILNRQGTQLVEDAPDFHSVVCMRITAILGRDQCPITPVRRLADVWGVIVPVTQDKFTSGGNS